MDKKTIKQYSEEAKSWLLTFIADIAVDIAAGILIGVGQLVETGDLSTAAIYAVVIATARSVIKLATMILGQQLQTIGKSMKKLK